MMGSSEQAGKAVFQPQNWFWVISLLHVPLAHPWPVPADWCLPSALPHPFPPCCPGPGLILNPNYWPLSFQETSVYCVVPRQNMLHISNLYIGKIKLDSIIKKNFFWEKIKKGLAHAPESPRVFVKMQTAGPHHIVSKFSGSTMRPENLHF